MGRSVSYPSNTLVLTFATLETGYEATEDDVEWERAESAGEWVDDPFAYDNMIEDLVETCRSIWPSLSPDKEWLDREDYAVLSNGLVRIGVSEYCGMLAYWIVAHERTEGDPYYGTPNTSALAARWASQIEDQFVSLFGKYRKLGSMSNGAGVYQRLDAA